jgi:AbrB family looped-hinge helix DNA binding protein
MPGRGFGWACDPALCRKPVARPAAQLTPCRWAQEKNHVWCKMSGVLITSVTISPKYQVVIPKAVRRYLGIQPGQKMHVLAYDDKVVLISVRPVAEARGWLKGMDTCGHREESDEDRP